MRWVIFLLLVLTAAPAAQAQGDPQEVLYDFQLEVEGESPIPVPFGGKGSVEVTFHDLSRDSTATAAEGAPSAFGFFHFTSFSTEIVSGDPTGWVILPMSSIQTRGGDSITVDLEVLADNTVLEHTILVRLQATASTQDGDFTRNLTLQFQTDGLNGFTTGLKKSISELQPGEVAQAAIFVTNPSLFPQTFHMELGANPCGLQVGPPASVTLQPREANRVVFFSVAGPEEKMFYFFENCGIAIDVYPASDPNQVKTASVSVVVNGGYLDPTWAFWGLAIIAGLIILFLVLARRKAIIEEELLGKPQRPWTIPVERVYLQHLEKRDPRAAYVVRHFLMEEEYQSALLWYKSYKAATKGTRSKESLVVRQEKSYERFQKKWEKKIARPVKKADRFENKLQRKLDRQAKAGMRKDRRKWKKQVAKAEAAHEKKSAKQMAAWEKAVAKADKRGEQAPPKPSIGSPDLPPEPTLQAVQLADHKWAKKADRKRRRMVKKQGNIEVRFEKKDARRLAKVRRKVQRIARKIDDPEFAEEHPLLN